MFDPDALREVLARKQANRITEEGARILQPSPSGSEDTFGRPTLKDIYHISAFEEERELHFMAGDRLEVLRPSDGKKVRSIEEALPGGRDEWKLSSYHIDPDRAALVLHFLPISGELAREAGECLEVISEAQRESEDVDPEDFTLYDEEELEVQVLVGKYEIQVTLVGKYEIFLSSPRDGATGEYVRRGKSKRSGKMHLKYVELSDDIKIATYVLTKHGSSMKHIRYYL